MYFNEKSDAPKIERVEVDKYVRFKPKDGVFEIYDKETKEKTEVKEISLIPVNDSRFTVKAAQNDDGAFIFSGMYRDARESITVLRSEGGRVRVYAEGSWSDIKGDANLKYTRVMYAVLRNGKKVERAEVSLQGIALVQWGKIRQGLPETPEVVVLSVSSQKTFSTPKGMFYEMVLSKTDKVHPAEDAAGHLLAENVQRSFASHDANRKYRKQETEEAKATEAAISGVGEETVKGHQVSDGTIDLDSPKEELRAEDVPF